MAIKTREFSTETGDKLDIGMLINLFLSSGYVDKLIDIKYQTVALDMHGMYTIRTSALIIYKEVEA